MSSSEEEVTQKVSKEEEVTQKVSKEGSANKRQDKKNYGIRRGKSAAKERKEFEPFDNYWKRKDVSRGLSSQELYKGTLKIHPKDFEKACLKNDDGVIDIVLHGMRARNRALHGDVVAVNILPKSCWELLEDDYENYLDEQGSSPSRGSRDQRRWIPDRFYQRSGEVVYIFEELHATECIGYMKKQGPKAKNALFSPDDLRMPRILVPLDECPDGFEENPKDFASTIFIVEIEYWHKKSVFPKGHLLRVLGESGQIEPETERILFEQGIDSSEFTREVLHCLPKDLPWQIPQQEIECRRDLRNECTFTIDPASSNDLDDALHCKQLHNNEYELGVHIADVSYFVEEDTALDDEAGLRATSVYLVQKTIPMLPPILGEQLCSLLPGQDRLTFSVIWRMNAEGEILDEWCGRSVIRSCVKMSYDLAQDFIENPERELSVDEIPPITNGFDIRTVADSVINLNKIAVQLRQRRFDNGALQSNEIKLHYSLDEENGVPLGFTVFQETDSHRLVQECMLLADKAVARRIYDAFEDTALLRRQPPPHDNMMDDLVDKWKDMGIYVEGSSSEELHTSLQNVVGEYRYNQGMNQIMTNLFSKTMQRALYFCTGTIDDEEAGDEEAYRHYALNEPLFTHFTSPIRRYADIIVHRLLAASLDFRHSFTGYQQYIEDQASLCNEKDSKANKCSLLSREMFFAIYIAECGPLDVECMVTAVQEQSIDVLMMKVGVQKRVYCQADSPLTDVLYDEIDSLPKLTLVWEADDSYPQPVTQIVKIFTIVTVTLEATKYRLKYNAILKRTEEETPTDYAVEK